VEKILPSIQTDAGIVEGVTALIPGAGAQTALTVERVAFAVLGDVAAAVSAADDAAVAKGVNVTLDAEVVTAVKTLVADFKGELQTAGLLKPATKTA
jgi:phage tail sheath gpL-like